jgi:mono/diheme cytochrome c family protein
VRVATAVAGALAVAAAVMVVLAFTGGDESDERAAAPPTATPAATAAASSGERDGLAVWAEQGCGSCHTLAAANAHGFIGPDLASSLKGVPASYIKDSIVAPSKAAAAGYTVGGMPEDYAARISPDDLDRLVTFLQQSARR